MAVEIGAVAVELGELDFDKACGTGYLLHDAFGLKARFEPDGEPLTELNFEVYPFHLMLQISKQSVPDQIVLKDIRYDPQTGIAAANDIVNAVQSLETDLEACLSACMDGAPNLMSVDEAFMGYGLDGIRQFIQRRFLVMQTKAVEFRGSRDFRAKSAALLAAGSDIESFDLLAAGVPCVAVRVLRYSENGGLPGVHSHARLLNLCLDANKQSYMSPEKSVLKFLETNADWLRRVTEKAGADSFFELIPMQKYDAHALGLPKRDKDDWQQYCSVALDPGGRCIRRGNNAPVISNGFAESIMLAKRDNQNDPWRIRQNIRMDMSGPIAPLAEVQTPILPTDWSLLLRIRSEQRTDRTNQLRDAAN